MPTENVELIILLYLAVSALTLYGTSTVAPDYWGLCFRVKSGPSGGSLYFANIEAPLEYDSID